MMPAKKVIVASGKRRTAMARAVVRPGTGKMRINRIPVEIFEPEIAREKIREPFIQAGEDVWKDLDMDVTVKGGGYIGQAEAARMAIANGLLKWSKSSHLRTVFAEYDRTMIVGDSRKKEPKKFGGRGARARNQKSYR
jgi:small subunit ribosomal protein S9